MDVVVTLAPQPFLNEPTDKDLASDYYPEEVLHGLVCDGPYSNKKPTQIEISEVVKKHSLWLNDQKGERANLCHADLSGIDLERVNLRKANLSHVNLNKVNLSDADLSYANLNMANLEEALLGGTNLANAYLGFANLKKASMVGANLSNAQLLSANMKDAAVFGANFKLALFELANDALPNIYAMQSAKHLYSMTYGASQASLLELRQAFRSTGMRDKERQITYAIRRSERIQLPVLEQFFSWLAFDYTSRYGMAPWRPILLLLWLMFVFSLVYTLPILWVNINGGCIWVIYSPSLINAENKSPTVRPLTGTFYFGRSTPAFHTGVLLGALHFSLLSAFNIGWRDFNVGNWISRLQMHEYIFRPSGWVRPVAGLQSLISLYLLALWLLSYFGRLFDQ